MSKKHKDSKKHKAKNQQVADAKPAKMKTKEYEREMRILQGELVAMQEWVKATGPRSASCSRGWTRPGRAARSSASRSGPVLGIQAHRTDGSHRARSVADVHPALHGALPSAGEVAIFDRSWYNRAGVEPVMGYCTPEESRRFLEHTPAVEKAMADSGMIILGTGSTSASIEQTRRLSNRITDPRKVWKLSPTDLKSYSRHYDYCRARDIMLEATDTSWAPWFVVDNDDKRGRLNIISHLLSQILRGRAAGEHHHAREAEAARVRRAELAAAHHIPTPF